MQKFFYFFFFSFVVDVVYETDFVKISFNCILFTLKKKKRKYAAVTWSWCAIFLFIVI